MFELIVGCLIGVGVGTYYHEKTIECYDPCLEQVRLWRLEVSQRYREWRGARSSQLHEVKQD